MTQFKAGDEIQFNEDAVREAHRLDRDDVGNVLKGYAARIISSGALEKRGEILRTDYGDEAPFQIRVPGMYSSLWAEEEWLKTPDKFQPGDLVDWVKADKYWRGVEVFERKDFTPWGTDEADKIIEGYRVWGPLPGGRNPGLIAASELMLHQQKDDYDEWKANDSADYYHSGDDSADSPDYCECGCDYSPDEAPVFRDYKPVVDEVQDDKVWPALDSLKTGGPYSMTFTVVPEVKDPDAPTVEELKQGINITDYITDPTGFYPLGTWEEPELVNHPAHYGGEDDVYEVIKVIEAWGLGFHLGSAVKYIPRAGVKDPDTEIQDLEKARWYIDRRIQWLKENEDV